MTSIFAIDPGPRLSAYVELVGTTIRAHGKVGNLDMLQMLRTRAPGGPLVVEMIAPYGRIVGREVFETCLWVGRYLEAWRGVGRLLERREVKKALGLRAGGPKAATDTDVRRSLIERWGGKATRKACDMPVPLRGVTRDEWAALAVAVAWREQHGEAFAAVEDAPLSGLEDLNRVLGLLDGPAHAETPVPTIDATQNELHDAGPNLSSKRLTTRSRNLTNRHPADSEQGQSGTAGVIGGVRE